MIFRSLMSNVESHPQPPRTDPLGLTDADFGPATPPKTSPGFWETVREDYNAHGRDWTKPGFRAVFVHRFGNWRMNVKPKILRAPFSVLYRMMFRRVRNHYGIELPYTVKLGRRVVIEHQGAIVIHGGCEIGDGCVIRQGCTLGNKTLDRPLDAPKLGRLVNVGAGAKVLGAVTIGDGAAIGANAVVVKDIPAGATAVGIPAQIVPAHECCA
ncbi:MAG: serine O-acetyltransferase [Tepidisphaeraceae bacterium]